MSGWPKSASVKSGKRPPPSVSSDVIFLRYKDGELFPTLELRRDITRMIRLKKPDVVVTLDPTRWFGSRGINHPDHRAIGAATLEAVFPTARDRLNFIEHERDEGLGNAQGGHRIYRRRGRTHADR